MLDTQVRCLQLMEKLTKTPVQASKAHAPAQASPLFPHLLCLCCCRGVSCCRGVRTTALLPELSPEILLHSHTEEEALNVQKCLKAIKVTHYKTSSIY